MKVSDPDVDRLRDLLRAAFRAGEAHAYWSADRWDGPPPEDEDAAVARIAGEAGLD